MELHESLQELADRLGPELFSDADSFRGALDDYVDEASASTGEVNLLVDAVRLGAFRSMTAMLDTGASADSAIVEAGARLARDRGSSEAAGAMWACAVLGYAVGRVSGPQLRMYAAQRTTRQPPPPALGGPANPAPPPPPRSVGPASPPAPPWPSSGGARAPQTSSVDRPTHPRRPLPPPVAPAGALPPPVPGASPVGRGRRRRVWPFVAAAAVVLLVLGVGIPTAILLSGGEPEEQPTETVALGEVADTYAELGEDVTAGVTECTVGDRADGETEALACVVEGGTLRLVTYDSEADLEDARDSELASAQGSILIRERQGVYYSFDPGVAAGDGPARLYWDDESALQSAALAPEEDLEDAAAALQELFEATSPTLEGPDEVVDSDLSGFLDTFNVSGCDRIPNQHDGVTESDECQLEGNPVLAGRFEGRTGFNAFRRGFRTAAQDAGCPTPSRDGGGSCVNDLWFTDVNGEDGYQPYDGDLERGRIWAHVDGEGNGVVYAERRDCRCYLVMTTDGGDADDVTGVLGDQLG